MRPRRIKLELYQLVWLISSPPMFNIERINANLMFERLTNVVDKTMIFNNIEECLAHVQQSEQYDFTSTSANRISYIVVEVIL